ncbi:AbrB/MazE/SpoVT family DNA-binding domain-containing protein [Aureibacillus halotolerans]|uniref:Antitoxin MazE n=1 Tax=Aureibacillus halotolerans TaxID=1508390 RepID=A0A4R6U8K1_9BACI|nr:AbrB/MazE/SpoVT family DNA-binding domain-containing protein [Aureibacillus halotolerans]TDQ42910.1 antitoxin MazE [Aureibacillus halotolerans]
MRYHTKEGGDPMSVTLKQWGNSLSIRIPRTITNTLALSEGSELTLEIMDNAIVLKPKQKKHTLAEAVEIMKTQKAPGAYFDDSMEGEELI